MIKVFCFVFYTSVPNFTLRSFRRIYFTWIHTCYNLISEAKRDNYSLATCENHASTDAQQRTLFTLTHTPPFPIPCTQFVYLYSDRFIQINCCNFTNLSPNIIKRKMGAENQNSQIAMCYVWLIQRLTGSDVHVQPQLIEQSSIVY